MKKIINVLLISLTLITMIVMCTIQAISASVLENDNLYYIKNKRSGKFLTFKTDGSLVQMDRDFTEYQRFFIREEESVSGIEYYAIIPDLGGVDSEGNSFSYRINAPSDTTWQPVTVVAQSNTNTQAQRFRFISNGDQSYKIMPRLSNSRVLDVVEASSLDNAGIQLYLQRDINDTFSNAQDWLLASAVKSILTWDLVDSGKHLDWNADDTIYSEYVSFSMETWNSYKPGVIREDGLLTMCDVKIIDATDLSPNVAGNTSLSDKKIRINSEVVGTYTENQIKNLITHELGHTLGMGHINGSNNVLYYTVNSRIQLQNSNKNSYDLAYSRY